jgi:hypothetical protein
LNVADLSEEQFQELLAHLIARVNKALAVTDQLPALSLALTGDGSVEVAVGVGEGDDLGSVLTGMQSSLAERAGNGEILASCIAYPDYGAGCVYALLENVENYCGKASLPVVEGDGGHSIDPAGISMEDGSIFVFPVVEED